MRLWESLAIVNHCQEPHLEMQNFLRDVSLGNKVTTLTTQRDFLSKLIVTNRVTPEIRNLAKSVMQSEGRSQVWERRILKQRKFLKEMEIVDTRRQWNEASRFVESKLPAHKVVEYRQIKRSELNLVWNHEKQLKEAKIRRMQGKVIPEVVRGVRLTDRFLVSKFGDQQDEGLVVGDIEVSDNVRAFLRMDPKFKTYCGLNEDEFQVDLEHTATKQVFSRLEDAKEDISNEIRSLARHERNRRRDFYTAGSADYSRMRTSDFKFTKRIGQPPDLPEREQTKILQQKLVCNQAFDEVTVIQ